MGMWPQRIGIAWIVGCMMNCAAPNPHVRAKRLPDGSIQVEGPLAGPYPTLEELAVNACELMTGEPGASNGSYGFEYCALNYFSKAENAYFLSYLSTFKKSLDSATTKTCLMPTSVDAPAHPDALIVGVDHTHPHNRAFSKPDLSAWIRWNPTRLYDKSTGMIWDRHMMLFYRERTGECRAYMFNTATRTVSALRERKWVPIGEVYTRDGDVRMFEGQDWIP